jgi:hypothetical protein
MKKSNILLGSFAAILAACSSAANAQVSVNGQSQSNPYDLSTSNQVAGANGSLDTSSGAIVTQSAPDALIGTASANSSTQYPYQFNYQIGGGTVTLSQSNANFAAPIALDGGTLNATATGALGSSAVDLFYGSTLNLSATNALSGSGSVSELYSFQGVQINITAPQNYSGVTTTSAFNQNTGQVALTISGNGNLSNSTVNAVGPNTVVDLETTNAISGGTFNFMGATVNETAANAISGTTAVNLDAVGGNAILSAANNYRHRRQQSDADQWILRFRRRARFQRSQFSDDQHHQQRPLSREYLQRLRLGPFGGRSLGSRRQQHRQ